jgi:hypothetical protein
MAKFYVDIVTTVTKRANLEVNITRKRLVEEGFLQEGEDWKASAESYIHENLEDLIQNEEMKWNRQPFDPCSDQWEYEEDSISVEDVGYD